MKTRRIPSMIPGMLLTGSVLLAAACPATASDDDDDDKGHHRNLDITEVEWEQEDAKLKIKGKGASGNEVSIYDASSGVLIGQAKVKKKGKWKFKLKDLATVPCVVRVESADDEDEMAIDPPPVGCGNNDNSGASGEHQIFAVNDLGMHCMDDDFSVFSILPPFNNLHAQVVNKAGKPILMNPDNVEVRYTAIADPSGSINSTSIGKTNFWDHVQDLFGISPEPDVGLTGNRMPSEISGPQVFTHYDIESQRYVADGIPITPRDDFGQENFFPLFRIEAIDKSSGEVLASVDSVVPVSEEMACADCHHSGGEAADDLTAARYGDVLWSNESTPAIQYRENILLLHDAKHRTSLMNNQPVLCAQCHYSPALDLAGAGPQGIQNNVPFLSYAIHKRHGETLAGNIPTGNIPAIISDAGTDSCFSCHPGKQTQCFRGAMASAGLNCQNCHGGLLAVGGQYPLKNGSIRMPWLDMPKCQSCHVGDALNHQGNSIVTRLAYDPDDKAATPILADNKRFAEPDTGLYRFSTGHGGMDCTSCHGSPHAIWPNADANANDNIAAMQIQGHAGTITECNSCHTPGSLPLTLAGPHGMHNVNDPRWGEDHGDLYEDNPASCQSCHGINLEGTRLSRTTVDRTYQTDDDDDDGNNSIWLAKGTKVSCTLCHERP